MDLSCLTKKELADLISQNTDPKYLSYARELKIKHFGKSIYVRGLIEFTNYCKNNCFYCGIRCDNKNALRYRLTKKQILDCCNNGYNLGFRTFVLQGGEDLEFSNTALCDIVYEIKNKFNDCAVTLSVGEKSYEDYKALKSAGADRYLLRHETADCEHYGKLHPKNMSLKNRKECLYNLKELGFQTGAGFMVGSPYQTSENLADDLLFLKELQPDMVGIGPFIPHNDTIFKDYSPGTLDLTVKMIALTRILLPKVLLPSTTALSTIAEDGRERGFMAGANVVMPNLTPEDFRENYSLYNNKLSSGAESGNGLDELKKCAESCSMELDMGIGNSIMH